MRKPPENANIVSVPLSSRPNLLMQQLFFILSAALFVLNTGLAQPVYTINDSGYLLLEAERLSHSDLWELVSGNIPNSGRRTYLKYVGPVTGSGHDQETDHNGTLQGDSADWLIIPVEIKEPGRYRMNLRNHHMHKDGDNDIWVHIVGWPPPIRRVGDHAVDSFQWLTWGTDWVYWDIEKPGVYRFYVAGRSQGFGVDRIAIYNEKAPITMYHREIKASNE